VSSSPLLFDPVRRTASMIRWASAGTATPSSGAGAPSPRTSSAPSGTGLASGTVVDVVVGGAVVVVVNRSPMGSCAWLLGASTVTSTATVPTSATMPLRRRLRTMPAEVLQPIPISCNGNAL
jgi:hypothetical protein